MKRRLPSPRRLNPTTRYQPVRPYRAVQVIAVGGQPALGPAPQAPAGGGAGHHGHHGHHGGWNWGCGWGGCWGPWYPWPWPYTYALQRPTPALPLEEEPMCRSAIVNGRLAIDEEWAVNCFAPIYQDARAQWGSNAAALATDVLVTVMPDARLGTPASGPEYELRRRIELAVAVLLGAEGIPTRFPADPVTPRPRNASKISTPWIRALVTGWI